MWLVATVVTAAFPERAYKIWVPPGLALTKREVGGGGGATRLEMLRLKPCRARPSLQTWLTRLYPDLLCVAEAFSGGLPGHVWRRELGRQGAATQG